MKAFRSESDVSFCVVLTQICRKKARLYLPKELCLKCLSFSPSHRFMKPTIPEFDWDMDLDFISRGSCKYRRKNGIKQTKTQVKLKKAMRFR